MLNRIEDLRERFETARGRLSLQGLAELDEEIRKTRLFRSIFRHPWPETSRDRLRIVLGNVFLHLHPVRVHPRSLDMTYTFGLGGISFFLFLIETITGVLLMFYYIPATTLAYTNIQDLEQSVNFGMLMRNMHRFGAQGMVIMVFLHMCRVFYTGSYRPPREFNWVVGIILLVLTFLLSFTGYLLPWDQLALWAITVGTTMAGTAPVFGPITRFMLIGGYDVGQNTLIRFYTLHVIAFPLLLSVFLTVHFWRIRKDGFSRNV